MTIDLYTATGTKQGTLTLPASLFAAPISQGLMHQMVVMQQSNRRGAVASTKSRGEIRGSTRKLFAQKGTGRARRGSVRSPVLRGGNKAFGPQKNANFEKSMPRTMRRRALVSSLSLQAQNGVIIGLKNFPEIDKTKDALTLLNKLPVEIGRKVLIVVPESNAQAILTTRNIPNVKVIQARYLNPVDVLGARHIVFCEASVKVAEETFCKDAKDAKESEDAKETRASTKKKSVTGKAKTSSASSASSASSDSSN